jgi:TonB-linked SusC/RagA family outer membrane protein
MRKILLSLSMALLWTTCVLAQERTLTGTVTASEDGLTLPGVSVRVKGSATGTQTGTNGQYSIRIPDNNAVLIFSYIGFATQEVTVGNRNVVNVALQTDATQLGEVVVTALGISRAEKALGYSVTTVEPDALVQKSEPDVLKSLQGKVAGVDIRTSQGTPGAATRVNLRGFTSFYGTNEPLIVVDGIPYSNEYVNTSDETSGGGAYTSGLSTLDPNDIESMTVLKGAAAAALYGSRASNGALIIRTKSGSSSASKKGFEVTYASSASLETVANLPDYQNTYGTGTLMTYANANGSWGAKFGTIDSIPTYPAYLAAFPNMPAKLPYQAYPNNVSGLFRDGTAIENSLSLTGGTGNSSISSTASFLNHRGYVPNSSFNRANLSLGGQTKLANGLTLNGNFSYSRSNQKGSIFGENQTEGATSAFARTLFLGRNWNLELPYEDANGLPVSTNPAQYDNPLWAFQHNTLTDQTDRYVAGIKLGYQITPWLNANYQIGANNYAFARRQVVDIGSRGTIVDGAAGLGSMLEQDYRKQEIESNLIFSLTPKLRNSNFSLTGTLGYNVNQRTINSTAFKGTEIVVPRIYSLSNTKTVLSDKDNTYLDKRRLWGLFGEATAGYRGFAYLTLTGRNDWSSTLPTDKNSYFYPSISGSVVFTDALKMNWGPLDFGKIRASWAKVGKDADPYSLQSVFQVQDPVQGQPAATLDFLAGNPNLAPEFTTDFEVGTQLQFLKNAISLDVAWYNRNSTNLIAPITVPSSSGFNQAYFNIGKLVNQGVELELGLTPINKKDFSVNIKGIFTRNRSEIKELIPGVERLTLNAVLSDISSYLEVGQPFGVLRGSVNVRDDEGNLLINPTTGMMIRSTQPAVIGDPNPDYKAGLNLGANYKGFFFNTLFDLTKGGDIYSVTVSSLLGRGVTKDTEQRESSYIIPGYYGDENTGLPILDANGNKVRNTTALSMNELYFGETFAINSATEWNTFDGTLWTWRELTFGYNFPKSLFKRIPIGNLALSFSARNLWYLAPYMPRYTNFNPEVNSFGASTTQGIELSAVPTTRRYGLNLKVTF